MRYVAGAFRLMLVALLILVILFIIYCVFPFVKGRRRGRVIRRVSGWIPAVLGMKVAVKGEIPDEGARLTGWADSGCGYMVCADHISFVDVFVMNALMPVRFVAKKEIGSWPVFGAITTGVGTIYIDRSSRRAVLDVAKAMCGAMQAGQNVLFFPEGTTGPGDALLPFHANLFAAAVAAEAEILPVAIRYTLDGATTTITSYKDLSLWEVLKRIVTTPGLACEVTILKPIPAAGRDRRELCLEASRVMSAALGVPDATAEHEEAARRRREERLKEIEAEEAAKAAQAAKATCEAKAAEDGGAVG